MKYKLPSLLAALVLVAGTSLSQAQIISVNFVGGNAGNLGTLPSGAVAGADPAANWNNFTGGSGAPGAVLQDSTGSTSAGVTLGSYSSAGVWDLGSGGVSTPDQKMVYSYITDGPGQTINVSLSGIPFSSYNIIVYVQGANNDVARVTTSQSGSPAFYVQETASLTLTQVTSTTPGSPGIGTYTVFTGLTNSSLNLMVTSVEKSPGVYGYVGLAGFQIVAVPEPTTVTLLAGGCFALVGFARRRKA